MTFFESSFLWLDVVVAAALSGAAVAAVGVHATLRRVVFLPAALSQVAGLGVVTWFLLAHRLPGFSDLLVADPGAWATLFTAAGALALGFVREGRAVTREWLLGAAFVVSAAAVLLIGGAIPQGAHDVDDVLFGNAIALERAVMWQAVGVSVAVLALHVWLARPFVATAFDPETARAHGVPVRGLDAVLFLTMGAAIATNTRVVGALPAFAFAVFPGAGALTLVREARSLVLLAALTGALDAFLGYWLSFELSLPTGACMATVAAGLYALQALAAAFVKRRP